jgi:hypothetical protein
MPLKNRGIIREESERDRGEDMRGREYSKGRVVRWWDIFGFIPLAIHLALSAPGSFRRIILSAIVGDCCLLRRGNYPKRIIITI